MHSAEEFFEVATWMERHLPRQANDAIAMEASSLFIQEFIRGRSGAYGDLQGELLWGVWPKHPYDDAVARLRALFSRCFQEGGSFAGAVQAAVEAWKERGAQGLGVPGAQASSYSDDFLHAVAKTAVRNAAAEAIGGTACAWAHDARWYAADFSQVKELFESERACRIEREGHTATMPLDDCGGVGCCLDLAAFLFSTHYAVAPSLPGQDAPFVWSKEAYEAFAQSMVEPRVSQETMRAFAEENPHVLLDPETDLSFLHPCLFRDPFALALEETKGELQGSLVLEYCKKTGRERPGHLTRTTQQPS